MSNLSDINNKKSAKYCGYINEDKYNYEEMIEIFEKMDLINNPQKFSIESIECNNNIEDIIEELQTILDTMPYSIQGYDDFEELVERMRIINNLTKISVKSNEYYQQIEDIIDELFNSFNYITYESREEKIVNNNKHFDPSESLDNINLIMKFLDVFKNTQIDRKMAGLEKLYYLHNNALSSYLNNKKLSVIDYFDIKLDLYKSNNSIIKISEETTIVNEYNINNLCKLIFENQEFIFRYRDVLDLSLIDDFFKNDYYLYKKLYNKYSYILNFLNNCMQSNFIKNFNNIDSLFIYRDDYLNYTKIIPKNTTNDILSFSIHIRTFFDYEQRYNRKMLFIPRQQEYIQDNENKPNLLNFLMVFNNVCESLPDFRCQISNIIKNDFHMFFELFKNGNKDIQRLFKSIYFETPIHVLNHIKQKNIFDDYILFVEILLTKILYLNFIMNLKWIKDNI